MPEIITLDTTVDQSSPTRDAVIFDIFQPAYRSPIGVELLDGDHSLKQRIVGPAGLRVYRALEVADHLLHIAQIEDESFVELRKLVKGNNKHHRIQDHRSEVMYRLRTISEAYDDILEFQNVHKITEIRAQRPFSVGFTPRSKRLVEIFKPRY